MRQLSDKRKSRAGFTILEITIVAAVIGMLGIMALPSFMKSRRNARIQVMLNEFRIVHDALNMYAMDNNGFPSKFLTFIPHPVSDYLKNARWTQPTALGGHWMFAAGWDTNLLIIDDFNAGSSGDNPLAPSADWLAIDEQIDDGDLSTGMFRMVGNIQVQYSIDNYNAFPNLPTS